jgi:hypothetical protein
MIEIRNDINSNEKLNYVKAQGLTYDIARELACGVRALGEEKSDFFVGLFPVLVRAFGVKRFKELAKNAIELEEAKKNPEKMREIMKDLLSEKLEELIDAIDKKEGQIDE